MLPFQQPGHPGRGLETTDAATATLGDTVWAAFDHRTTYFGPGGQDHMVNYRVDDLDAALRRLRQAHAVVAPEIQQDDYGRFAWAVDPEGVRFELWEPADRTPAPEPEPTPDAE